ncbi:MAG: MFS transporter [Bacteroidales bacterium]
MAEGFEKNRQYYKFSLYGFFKNLRFFEAFLMLFFLSKGLDYWQIGVIYTVREVTRNIFETPSGVVSDSIGRRSSLAFSFTLYITSYLVFYFSESYGIILFAMFFFAAGDALRSGTNKAMIYSYLDHKGWAEDKAAYYGNTRSWSQSGYALSSLMGAAFIWFSGNYSFLFLASVVPALLNLMLILSYPRKMERSPDAIRETSVVKAFRSTFLLLWKQMGKLIFWHNTNLVALHSGYYKAVKDYLQPIMASLALSIPLLSSESELRRQALWVGVFYFVIYSLSSIASRNSGRFSELVKRPARALSISMYSGLFLGISGGIFAWQGMTGVSVAMLTGIFLVENIRKPIGVGNLADSTHAGSWTSVLSLESQTASLYGALMAPLIGVFADINGPGFGLAMMSGIAIAFSIILDIFYKHK